MLEGGAQQEGGESVVVGGSSAFESLEQPFINPAAALAALGEHGCVEGREATRCVCVCVYVCVCVCVYQM